MTTIDGAQPVDGSSLRSHIRGLYEAGTIAGDHGARFPLAPQGVLEPDGEALRDLALREGAVSTIETGLCYGLSTLFLCEALAASGRPDARHVAMDPFQTKHLHNAGLCTLREAGVDGMVEFHDRPSQLVLPELLADGRVFDLAFIDGDHRFDAVMLDLYYLHQMVRPGGLIVLDDVWMAPVRMAALYFVTNVGLEVAPSPFAGHLFRVAPAGWWQRVKGAPHPRLAVLRRPAKLPRRPWLGHFVPFADAESGMIRVGVAKAVEQQARRRVDQARPLIRKLRGY